MLVQFVVLLLFLHISGARALVTDCSNLNRSVVIRNQWSGLMLDARNENIVTIERFDGGESQQWYFELSSTVGLFNIISRSTGKALDVNLVTDPAHPQNYNATLNELTDSVYQRWYINYDGTIVNVGLDNYGLNIPNSEYDPGNYILVYPRFSNDNEKFILEFEVL